MRLSHNFRILAVSAETRFRHSQYRRLQSRSIFWQLTFVTLTLICWGEAATLAATEQRPSAPIGSACRHNVPSTEIDPTSRTPNSAALPLAMAAGSARALGAREHAIELWSRAMELDPDNLALRINRAAAYASDHKLDNALKDYDRATALAPGSSIVFLVRAEILMRMTDYDRAIADTSKSIKLTPSNARAYLVRGLAHMSKRDTAAPSRIWINRSSWIPDAQPDT
ncbi:tetratricopeptide repeat protein [Bradyrhizobium sp. USDA 4452]